jgi:hypothetical protein
MNTAIRKRVAALEDRIAPKAEPRLVVLIAATTDGEEAREIERETERAVAAGRVQNAAEMQFIVMRSPKVRP